MRRALRVLTRGGRCHGGVGVGWAGRGGRRMEFGSGDKATRRVIGPRQIAMFGRCWFVSDSPLRSPPCLAPLPPHSILLLAGAELSSSPSSLPNLLTSLSLSLLPTSLYPSAQRPLSLSLSLSLSLLPKVELYMIPPCPQSLSTQTQRYMHLELSTP